MPGAKVVRCKRALQLLGFGGTLVGLLSGCSSPRTSGRATTGPEPIQAIYSPGFRPSTARLNFAGRSNGNLYWSNGWVRLKKDQKLTAGDIIQTTGESSLRLVLRPSYSRIVLFPGSTLAIEQLEESMGINGPSRTRLYLQEGTLRLQSGLLNSNSVEEVRTQAGVASSLPFQSLKRGVGDGVASTESFLRTEYEISADGDVTAIGPTRYTDVDGTTNLVAGAMKQLPLSADLPARKCPVHERPMKRKPGPIVYGLISADSLRGRDKHPNDGLSFAGCVIHANSPKTKIVWVCDACAIAAQRLK
jgi:hypothetical protein